MVNSQSIVLQVYIILVFFTVLNPNIGYAGVRKYTKDDLMKLREEVREMFNHAYSGYLKYAYPYDELRPLTCDGVDTWGSYSLTLIDALDTLAVMGNYSEFRRVVDIVTSKANFDANINVSVFETNIRIVGGLLSAHMLSQRAGVELEPGWPCNGPLLRLAEDVAKRLLAAFDTSTGMPYGTVNLRHGVPPGETSVTCTAAVGTYLLEFSALSRLTGDPIYEEVALNALHALYHHRSSIGLYGNHIDVMTGRWTAQDSGIGAGVDSFFEYLVKGAILIQRPELMVIFHEARAAIDKYLKRNDWYLWASMHKGQITLPIFQSLEAYWPGVLSLIGDISTALKSMHNYHQVWKQYGFTPELYNIPQGQVGANRESYPLRPELIESAMYLYRATGDPFMLDVGTDILRSIQHSARTKCGYATIKDCRDHSLENRMESFFLSETTKYLYLLFDTDNFIHNDGGRGLVHTLPSGKQCILDAGGYIFNTEAHPLDPGTLLCCSEDIENKKHYNRRKARGVKLNSFVKPVQENPSHTDNFQTTESAEKILLDQLPSSKTEESQPLLDQLPSALTEEFQPLLDQLPSALTEESQLLLDQLPPTLTEKSQPLLDQLPSVLTEESQSLHGEGGIKVDDEKSGEVLYFNNNNPSDEESQQSSLKKKTLSLGSLEIMETLINSYLKNSLIKTMWSRDLLHDLVRLIENTDIKNDQSYELPEEKRESTISDIKSIPSSVGNLEDSSLMKTEKVHAKGNKIFDLIITQQFITIKNTIAVEADNVMLHVYKCIENLELTKDLVDIAIENQLENEFFTKRLKIRGLATQITETVEESRKLIQIGESKDTVSLTFFKALVGSVVNGKTVNSFFKEYERYMELLKNLIKVGKRKYYDLEETKMGNSEDGISNDSENVSNERDEVKQNHGSDSSKSNIQNNNWKADGISYEVDDRERVTPVTKVDSGPLFTDKLTISPVEDIIGYLSKSLIPTETPFNPQVLLERIRSNPRYPRNETWMTRYELLTCLPQPYFTRITLYGEFFDES